MKQRRVICLLLDTIKGNGVIGSNVHTWCVSCIFLCWEKKSVIQILSSWVQFDTFFIQFGYWVKIHSGIGPMGAIARMSFHSNSNKQEFRFAIIHKEWDLIIHPCPGSTEVSTLMSNYIPQKFMGVVTYPCPNPSLNMLLKGAPGLMIFPPHDKSSICQSVKSCVLIRQWYIKHL